MTLDTTKLPADCEVWTSGDVTLIRGDCLAVLPAVSGVDAVVTDPPYGQKYRAPSSRPKPASTRGLNGNWVASYKRRSPDRVIGDDSPFDPSALFAFAEQLVWGAHRFSSRLPDGQWLVWDKREGLPVIDQGDCEAAWLNRTGPMRIVRHRWAGLIVQSGSEEAKRQPGTSHAAPRLHPTQKPVAVMEWCIGFIKSDAIIDPYMGSGTTGVACVNLGRKFIGIEISPEYFEIAKARILKAQQAKAEQLVA